MVFEQRPGLQDSGMSMNVLYSGKPGKAAAADIVFVHGLRGDPIKTWSDGQVCWPRDLLKIDLDNVRIMSWAYDAQIVNLKGSASQASVFGNAETLLSDLSNERLESAESSRPIIFVGHSLGGLVIKAALIRSAQLLMHNEIPEFGQIYQSVAGVVFMGTPHRGSDKVSFADMLVLAAKATWRKPNNELLNSLRSNAGILNQQRANFTTIMGNFFVVCLYEQSANSKLGTIVPEDSACFDGKNIRRDMLPGDHSEMCKFPDRNAIGYKRVVGHIKRLVVAARNSGGTGTDSGGARRESWSASPISRGLLIEPAPHCRFDGEMDRKEEELTQRVTRHELQFGLMIPTHILPPAGHKLFSRSDHLDAIRDCLKSQRHPISSQTPTCSINGLAGVGKSALAREYVEQHKDMFDIICWIPSDSRHNIFQRYNDLGRRLQVFKHNTLDYTDEDLRKVASWLSSCEWTWLLVFDRISDLEHLSGIIPQSGRQMCAILCTTQNSELLSNKRGKSITLPPLNPEQGATYLMQCLKANSDPESQSQSTAAKAASNLLGGVPLFLNVVADLLSRWQWPISVLIKDYDQFCSAVYGANEPNSFDGQLRHEPPEDVSHLFDYALQKLSAKGREVFSILVMLDGTEIAESLIFSQHEDDTLDFLRPRPVLREPSVQILSRELQKHNLVQRVMYRDGRKPVLKINAMVQQVVMWRMLQGPNRESQVKSAAIQAYKVLRCVTPTATKYQEAMLDIDRTPHNLRLDKHINHLGAIAAKVNYGPDFELATLLYHGGFLVWCRQIDLEEGIVLFSQALKFVPSSGDTQDDLLKSHIYLTKGRTYRSMGPDFQDKSAKCLENAWDLRKKVHENLGPYNLSLSHRIWLFCAKADVAIAKLEGDDIATAHRLFGECLEDYSSWCDEQEMPVDSAKVYYGLANCHLLRNDVDFAIHFMQKGKAVLERCLPCEIACCHLFQHACFLQQLNDRDRALSLHEHVLEARMRHFGDQGIPTLESRQAISVIKDSI